MLQLSKRLLQRVLQRPSKAPESVSLSPDGSSKRRVLVSYLKEFVLLDENDSRLDGHSNRWESREVCKIFQRKGYIVDVINWNDKKFLPQQEYDIIFDIHTNLQRLAPFLPKKTKKILHITGSYPGFSNAQEFRRVKELEIRRDCFYALKRGLDEIFFRKSLDVADVCSLIGNAQTLSTFPQEYQSKIHLVSVSGSTLHVAKEKKEYITRKEFLWFYGVGAVHKGLDLVLEVFKEHPEWQLNIVGKIDSEKDFVKIYHRELFELDNVQCHGYLIPNSQKFSEILRKCFCFIAPSCSEAISAAAVTCLQAGLYPVISIYNGIDLPENCGKYLYELTCIELEKILAEVSSMPLDVLESQIEACQDFAKNHFSREQFRCKMETFIDTWVLSEK